ncbi:MAG TPA: efflux RND transporter periplasmic adaptor subunit [Bacteroidales bacterium]|nr:efflux RND transporter periplasmic adaptor subunit [Bacteroidales bacterium]
MKYVSTISVILIGGLLFFGCSSKSEKPADTVQPAASATDRGVIPVKTLTLAKTRIARTIDYTATILPFEEVNMAPSTPGRVDRIYVEVGDRIRKGQDLFLMDRTQLLQLKLQLSNLEKDLSRLDTLLRTGSVKQQQYDQLKTQYDVTKTNVDFMDQNTLMKAPFDGIVTGKYFENGEMYSGTPTTPTGRAAVVTVMQINPLKVTVSISEQYYPLIRKGMKAEISADVYKNESFSGTVYLVSPTVNSATRSFNVELELANRNEMLKPGMFVRVSMDLGEVETFVVPANTVMVQEGTNTRYVFINKNNIAKRIEVQLGKRFDDQLEIIASDIKEGDMLVTEGQARLINGDRTELVN